MSVSLVTRSLFGGAITVEAPKDLIDVSTFRPLPDNQEVFISQSNDISIVVEVLQTVPESEGRKAIEFHFDALAHDNDAEKAEIEQIGGIPNVRGDATPHAIVLQGTQLIKKSNPATPDTVKILMALYRVQAKNVDLVATFNIPLVAANGVMSEADSQQATHYFHEFARSLTIVDFGLFA